MFGFPGAEKPIARVTFQTGIGGVVERGVMRKLSPRKGVVFP